MKTTYPLEHTIPYIPTSACIVRANRKQTIRFDLSPLQSAAASFKAFLSPVDSPIEQERIYVLENNGQPIELALSFGQEQEYLFLLYDEENKLTAKAFFYALNDDLFGALPMKADFHMHSTCSDGNIEYEKTAACCRRVGLDLMALTDHGKYEPSMNLIDLYSKIPHDLLICPGEEVHSPDNPVHIVNLNGSMSVNELFRNDEAAYRKEVQQIVQTIKRTDLNEKERFSVAASIWVARKIKACGGLAVFCHPYWLCVQHLASSRPFAQSKYISDAVEDGIWQSGAFDCVEMIGGFGLIEEHYDNNLRSVISYYEHTARGYHLNPVGTSDCHRWADDERMGWYYTIAFVRSWSLEGFIEAVRQGHCVAVEDYVTQFTGARAYGELRLVRYAQFLQRMVYPTHNALCREESALMSDALTGDQAAIKQLEAFSGRARKYLESCFAP